MPSTQPGAAEPGLFGGALAGAARQFLAMPAAWRVASLVLFFGAWEIAGRTNFNWAFPTFFETAAAMGEMIADGSMAAAYLRTMQPLAIGIAISLLVGVGAGVAMGLRRDVEWLALPIFVTMQAAPMAALIPLVTFVYGIGLTSKVLAVIMLALPVIAMNSYRAVRNVSALARRHVPLVHGLAAPAGRPGDPAGGEPDDVRGDPARGRRGVLGGGAGRAADHPDRDRRSHHLQPVGGEVRRHVRGDRLDRALRGDRRDAAASSGDRPVPSREEHALKLDAQARATPRGAPAEPIIAVRGIGMVYNGALTALKDIDLDFERGALTCLLGPSGCGKTTLLKIIAGLLTANGRRR